MTKFICSCSGYLIAMALAPAAVAQELTLFEPVETPPEQMQQQVAQPQPSFAVNQNGQPAYTLRGIVRVGDRYSVSVVNRAGVAQQLNWSENERVGVPGLPGYEIVGVTARSVALIQPPNDPCIEAPTLGVSCRGATQALLSITTATPLPAVATMVPQNVMGPAAQFGNAQFGAAQFGNAQPMGPQNPFEAAILAQQAQQQAQQAQMGVTAVAPAGAAFVNPFSGEAQPVEQLPPEIQAAREAQMRARAQRLNRFQQRIPDNQIPQGMQRVTTPFGDRLIQSRE